MQAAQEIKNRTGGTPATGVPSGVLEAAGEITRKVFKHVKTDHAAVKVLFDLGVERRSSLISVKDPIIQKEVRFFRDLPSRPPEPAAPAEAKLYRINIPDIDLPASPLVYDQLLEAVEAGNLSVGSLESILEGNQLIKTAIVRVLAESFPKVPRTVETVSQAAALLGPDKFAALAAGLAVMTDFSEVPAQFPDKKSFWMHSLSVGVLSLILAEESGLGEGDSFFTAGFLHDIGRLIMFKTRPLQAKKILAEAKSRQVFLHDLEPEEMGFGHSTLSAEFLRKWQMPQSMRTTVSYHHIPELSEQIKANSVVHMADMISHALGLGLSGEFFLPPFREEAWESLGIPEKSLRRIVGRAGDLLGNLFANPPEPFNNGQAMPFEFY